MRFSFLTLLIALAVFALALKFVDMIQGSTQFSESFLIGDLRAEEEEGEEDIKEEDIKVSPGYKLLESIDPEVENKVEKELLQSLAKRREALMDREKSIVLKENILKSTEKKIDKKITELKSLKQQVESLLINYNRKEEEKILSLVKIYESMKPAEASAIFEDMDPNILIKVLDRMKEARAGAILARMNPKTARMLTLELAKHKQIKLE